MYICESVLECVLAVVKVRRSCDDVKVPTELIELQTIETNREKIIKMLANDLM